MPNEHGLYECLKCGQEFVRELVILGDEGWICVENCGGKS